MNKTSFILTCIINDSDGKILFVKKKNSLHTQWEIPSDSVQGDVSFIKATKDMIKKEIGLIASDLDFVCMIDECDVIPGVLFERKWKQIYVCFQVFIKSNYNKIQIGSDFKDARWIKKEKIQKRNIDEITEMLLLKAGIQTT